MGLRIILEVVGLVCSLTGLYSMSHSFFRSYSEHAKLQADNLWLYNHCLENEKLRDVSDACDKVALLFALSPLQHAMEQWAWVKDAVWDGMVEYSHLCMAAGVALILVTPRLILPWVKRKYRKEKETLLRQAVESSTRAPTTMLRFRPAHESRRSMV